MSRNTAAENLLFLMEVLHKNSITLDDDYILSQLTRGDRSNRYIHVEFIRKIMASKIGKEIFTRDYVIGKCRGGKTPKYPRIPRLTINKNIYLKESDKDVS